MINTTWVNSTATTAPQSSNPVPPASVTNLHNTTYQQNSITWAWTDPSSADFDHVQVYLNGVFKNNVAKGTQSYTATGLNSLYCLHHRDEDRGDNRAGQPDLGQQHGKNSTNTGLESYFKCLATTIYPG